MRCRVNDLLAPEYAVLLEYPIHAMPRYGDSKPAHPKLASVLAAHEPTYRETMLEIGAFAEKLARIPETAENSSRCSWDNTFFSSMDAIALYGILGSKKPTRYFEVGSGNSTKFARRAIEDLSLCTMITSIDPAPRAEVDELCDRVVRQPLEDVDTDIFEQLQAGDVLFVDNSHRAFQNSDVTVFFLDVLPDLKPGIFVHLHDIFLPFDYPAIWVNRYYSEQYLLATRLLTHPEIADLILPMAYLSTQAWANDLMNEIWAAPIFQRAFERYRGLTGGYTGVSFWMRSR
jgi:Methyltransferase domain